MFSPRVTSLSGHYTFNLRDPAKMVQGMLMVDVKSSLRNDKEMRCEVAKLLPVFAISCNMASAMKDGISSMFSPKPAGPACSQHMFKFGSLMLKEQGIGGSRPPRPGELSLFTPHRSPERMRS